MLKIDNEKIIRLEENNKITEKRINVLEKKVDEIGNITLSIKELTMEIKQMREDVNKMDSRIDLLERKPQKRWDNLINQLISLLVAGIFGFVISKLNIS